MINWISAALAALLLLSSPTAAEEPALPDGQRLRLAGSAWQFQAYVMRMDDHRFGSLILPSDGSGGGATLTLTCNRDLQLRIVISNIIMLAWPAQSKVPVRLRFDTSPAFSAEVPKVDGNVLGLPGIGELRDEALFADLVDQMRRSNLMLVEITRGPRQFVWGFRTAGLDAAMREYLPQCAERDGRN
jgi:hypothetical protein